MLTWMRRPTSVIGGKADTARTCQYVRYWHNADILEQPRTWKTYHSGPSTFKHNLSTLERAQPYRASHCPRSVGRAPKDNYFGTPTNRAPVSLPSALMSGA